MVYSIRASFETLRSLLSRKKPLSLLVISQLSRSTVHEEEKRFPYSVPHVSQCGKVTKSPSISHGVFKTGAVHSGRLLVDENLISFSCLLISTC